MRYRLLLIAALLSLSGCGEWTSYAITLTNRSHHLVTDVSANFAGKEMRADRLIRGQFIVLASRGGKGSICLTFRQGGELRHYSVAYITENLPVHYQMVIRDQDILATMNDTVYQTLGEPLILKPLPPNQICDPVP